MTKGNVEAPSSRKHAEQTRLVGFDVRGIRGGGR
jgi:hypothetical protein